MNPRELLQSAQAAEREGDLARAGALLEQAARIYEATGHTARAAQMRRHVERLGPRARVNGRLETSEAEPLPGLDRPLVERTPTLADPALEAWCSFCCRPSREVGALVAGPAQAYVCRGCVALAASLLEGSAQSTPSDSPAAGDPPQAAGDRRPSGSAPGSPARGPSTTRVGPAHRPTPASGTTAEPRRPGDVPPEPLPTQAEAVRRIDAALAAGHARVLLVGAAGSGKSTWLQTWAARGLGTAWDGTEPLPEYGALLVDDVDRLEPAARRQLGRVLRSRPMVLALDATLPEPEEQVGGRRVHAPEQVESLAGSWLPGPVLDGLTLECFRAPGEDELRRLAERWRAPDGSAAQPDALEEALRLAVRSARAAHALHALLLRWWASR
ncbi:MAG TPA: ClpX C4-type zinc finger protein [Myxococcaceae bacterium]|nr:ClpX C4-type zinc finger protein [Myxococcaceae bacterium]